MSDSALLRELQDLDLQIMRSTKRLDEMPEKRAIIATRRKIEDVDKLKAKADELVRRLKQESQRIEDETSSLEAKIAAEEKRVMSGDISNAKELQHLNREIDSLKRRKDKLDNDELQLMERIEKAQGQVQKVDEALAKLHAEEERLVGEFKEKGGELQHSIEDLKKKRTKVAGRVSKEALQRYETMRETKGGVGLGVLQGGRCTACRIELPAQRVAELEAGEDIAVCPACRRLLLVHVEEPEE